MLDDSIPEPQETVLVYLTQPTGGARVANGTYDGGVKGFAEITIRPSDLSNGLIGFAENSKTVQANEDLNPNVTLTLTRLNAYYGNVQVVWKAKLSPTSSEADDVQLTNQLKAMTGVGICPPDQSLCTFQVQLIDDQIPEESFSFVVKLESVGDDARLNPDALFATVNVQSSDFVRGLVQFVPNSRTIIMGANSRWVVVGVQRVQGLTYDVLVGYTTRMPLTTTDAGVTVYAALEGEDFTRQQGTLVFRAQSQAVQYINVSLTPATASDNPFPKQFYIDIHDPSNGASISADYGRSVVRIVRGDEVAMWTIVAEQQKKPFNDTNILITLGGLDRQAQDPLTNNEVTAIDNMVKRINEEGTKRPLPEQVVDATLGLLCKMLDPSKVDATRGQHSLAERVEELTYNMLYGRGCPTPVADGLLTKSCAYVKVSAGRWTPVNLQGFEYEAQHKDVFTVPTELTISTGADGINDQCADFHIIEYNSRQWFPTQNEEQLLNNRVISFGMKGKASAPTSDPVKFRIHTPDSRVATKRAQCVYFDTSVEQWVSPKDVCYVENNLNLGMDNFVSCSCSHMTSYAVVAEVYDAGIIGYTIWFYIACFICMSCMALVIISHHLCHQRPTVASSLMQHMLFAIFAAQLCLVVDAYLSPTDILTPSAREDNYRCIVMGLFLHYFFLAQFMWIVVQSINFWQILIMNDEHTEQRYVIFFVLGWGLPLVFVALFYAVAFNVYKYETDLPVDYIYGDVYNNGEICFLTNAYASVGGIIVPVLLLLLMSGIVFIKAFQLSPQWQAYDDIYRGRYNSTEVQLLLFLWAVLALTCLWAGLHMVYSQLWMLVLFCISDILLGLLAFVLYAVIRNPCLNRCSRTQKEYYTASNTDIGTLPPPSLVYNNRLAISNNTINSLKGSRTSLINEAWERGTIGSKSQMTVRRATPSQVYLNPPIAIVSPSASSNLDPQDFDDLLFALKTGHSFTPSEMSRSIADDDSQLSTKLDRYETKRIDIADTHL
ncbi:hypothetical protein V1264_002272 [Littorina saxatilis]|uniref:Uncharacterized protein n=1 Tax=Littorina saxatilis TaxID=31220 RepID=A0AAN9C1D3_9CAEN